MIWRIFFLIRYVIYAKSAHGIHSPFVFQFINQVLKQKKSFPEIDSIIRNLKTNKTEIPKTKTNLKSRTIAYYAQYASKSNKYGNVLTNLNQFLKPEYAIELGTCLGISTLYQNHNYPNFKSFYTIEANSSLYQIAINNLKKEKYPSIIPINETFDHALPIILKSLPKLDYVFFDGDHKYESTIRYFHQCLSYINEKSYFIFDDIYWSKDMAKAWEYIRNHEKVSLSIDLFQIGIVFFENRIQKEHFVLRY